MKNIFTNLMTSAVLLFTLGSGLEAQTVRMHAAVPFAWQANGQQLNAGDYTITRSASSPVVRIEGNKDGKGAFFMVIPAPGKNLVGGLVFHRYGDRYFLAEVVAPGVVVGRVPASRAEREAMQSEGPREMATVFVDVRPLLN